MDRSELVGGLEGMDDMIKSSSRLNQRPGQRRVTDLNFEVCEAVIEGNCDRVRIVCALLF